jgi:peptide/nickel transport system ATP-binding protein
LLEVDQLDVRHVTKNGELRAVDKVSFAIRPGETLGLVGESGCGKSTLAKAIVRLIEPRDGSILLRGTDITHLSPRELRPHRRHMQMVFQDPGGSLDPRQRVGRILDEPLAFYRMGGPRERADRVRALMEQVGLRPETANRFPHEFSGGQRQRIAIARALALNPSLIVCDEPVSALDVSLQAQVLNLLLDLQRDRSVAYLFISHDLSVVQYLADRVAVMYLGRIVEMAPPHELWKRPAHPYTQALIRSVPQMDPAKSRIADKELVAGDLPNPFAPPSGCRFHTRCPSAFDKCRQVQPELNLVAPGHAVACHLHSAAATIAVPAPPLLPAPMHERPGFPLGRVSGGASHGV